MRRATTPPLPAREPLDEALLLLAEIGRDLVALAAIGGFVATLWLAAALVVLERAP